MTSVPEKALILQRLTRWAKEDVISGKTETASELGTNTKSVLNVECVKVFHVW